MPQRRRFLAIAASWSALGPAAMAMPTPLPVVWKGVTLGALSFPKNADGTLTKGNPRHPILCDNVTVYAGATILGRVTVGKGAVIGGNVWITQDVQAGARITQEKPRD